MNNLRKHGWGLDIRPEYTARFGRLQWNDATGIFKPTLGGLITASVVGLGLVVVAHAVMGRAMSNQQSFPQPPLGVRPLQAFQGQRW